MRKFLITSLSLFAAILAGCNFTTTNALITSFDEDVEAYGKKVVELFYQNEFQALIDEFSDEVDVKMTQLEYVDRLSDEKAKVETAKVISRKSVTQNGKKYLVLQYNVENSVGFEIVTITLVEPNDECCELHGFHVNVTME